MHSQALKISCALAFEAIFQRSALVPGARNRAQSPAGLFPREVFYSPHSRLNKSTPIEPGIQNTPVRRRAALCYGFRARLDGDEEKQGSQLERWW